MTVSITSQKLQKISCKHSIEKSILLNFANFVHDSSFFVRLWHETKKKKIVGPPSDVGWLVGKAVFLGKRSKDFSDFFG